MQRKRTKYWLIFGSIFLGILLCCFLVSVSLKVKVVDVEFRSRLSEEETMLSDSVKSEIKSYFQKNKNIVLLNTDEISDKIEKAYPLVKINQVLKNFPSTLRVYISERTPKYRVLDNSNPNNFLILDNDFKIIDIIEVSRLEENNYSNTSYFKTTMEISSECFSVTGNIGDFIKNNEEIQNYFNQVASGVYGKTEDYSAVRMISFAKVDGDYQFKLIMKNLAEENYFGCNILIDGTKNLKEKTYAGVYTFEEEVKGSSINNSLTYIEIKIINNKFVGVKYIEE